MSLVPLCHVMVPGSMSSLTNAFTSSFVKAIGSVLLMPSFYGKKRQIRGIVKTFTEMSLLLKHWGFSSNICIFRNKEGLPFLGLFLPDLTTRWSISAHTGQSLLLSSLERARQTMELIRAGCHQALCKAPTEGVRDSSADPSTPCSCH